MILQDVELMTEVPTEKTQQILLNVKTGRSSEVFYIEPLFSGQIILSFNQGGLAGVEKREKIKKSFRVK